ncbi:carboxymuconolactone decarboxylase family protein [Actinomadura sp. 7K534]|uniref:carboxymuconolactone decarboxylase family protein n=1 Tax=Actinomadura sp. 7K534 TaxID=2530366 RepID=UPI0010460B5E|nr:carboxymuconolactone decarboxylase family protein [Actinomadura sp. 7K534]TDB93977.1 carboxymuconolactone decarboxylase family protein [Actinomadura sp. 7K534]
MTTAQNAGQNADQNAVPDTGPYEETYRTLFGAVPGSVRERWEFSAEHGRFTAPGLLEELRGEVIVRSPLGLKVQQLVQFAQLAALGRADAARHHALAAVRAGARERDLLAVAETTLITSGVPGYSLALTLAREALAATDTPESSP